MAEWVGFSKNVPWDFGPQRGVNIKRAMVRGLWGPKSQEPISRAQSPNSDLRPFPTIMCARDSRGTVGNVAGKFPMFPPHSAGPLAACGRHFRSVRGLETSTKVIRNSGRKWRKCRKCRKLWSEMAEIVVENGCGTSKSRAQVTRTMSRTQVTRTRSRTQGHAHKVTRTRSRAQFPSPSRRECTLF